MKRILILLAALLACSLARAEQGLFNPTANSIGYPEQGIDSNKGSSGSALACTYTPVTTGTQNVAYTGATPSASGGTPAYTFSETGALPNGITINTSTGVLSGTPTVNGSFAGIQVKVTDTASTVANCGASFTLVISAPAFQGPGDIVSGAFSAYVLRAYNAADRGNRLINICDPSNVTCADWTSDATTGKLVASTNPLNGTDCTVSTSCTVKIWYDRSGATNCGGSACDVSQATAAARPTLTWSCLNGLPCLVFSSTQQLASAANLSAFSATATYSFVAERTANFTTSLTMISLGSASGVSVNLNFRQSANTVQMFSGTAGQVVANITDSNFHAFQAVYNGVSSDLMCGGGAGTNCSTAGTSNAISPGTTGSGASSILCLGGAAQTGSCAANSSVGVTMNEGLVYTSAFSGAQQTNMNANQYTFWGPF